VNRIEMLRGCDLTPLKALDLGQQVERFILDTDWTGQKPHQRECVADGSGTYWQQLHRAALLLLHFNILANSHPLPDPHWTHKRICKEIGGNYASIVAPAGIKSDQKKGSNSANNVKQIIKRYLPCFTKNTAEALAIIRRYPDQELASRYSQGK
jgi:hypothetical protein